MWRAPEPPRIVMSSAMRAPIGAKIRLVRRRRFRAWRGPHDPASRGLRQGQAHAETADLGSAKLEPAAIGVGKVGHDRMAEAGARLGLVQPASADDGLAQLRLREARSIVFDP